VLKRFLDEAPEAALLAMGLFAVGLLLSEGYGRVLSLAVGVFFLVGTSLAGLSDLFSQRSTTPGFEEYGV
jgi:hypothetical protein